MNSKIFTFLALIFLSSSHASSEWNVTIAQPMPENGTISVNVQDAFMLNIQSTVSKAELSRRSVNLNDTFRLNLKRGSQIIKEIGFKSFNSLGNSGELQWTFLLPLVPENEGYFFEIKSTSFCDRNIDASCFMSGEASGRTAIDFKVKNANFIYTVPKAGRTDTKAEETLSSSSKFSVSVVVVLVALICAF